MQTRPQGEKSKEIVRVLLANRYKPIEVAKKFGVKRQWVNYLFNKYIGERHLKITREGKVNRVGRIDKVAWVIELLRGKELTQVKISEIVRTAQPNVSRIYRKYVKTNK